MADNHQLVISRGGFDEVVVLGGGPAGLASAYYARKHGLSAVVLEKESEAGGLCRTFTYGTHRYDSGAHRLHDRDPEVTRELNELVSERLQVVKRPSKIRLGDHFIDFPPTPASLLKSGQVFDLTRIGAELAQARLRRREVISFADLAVQRFGKTLATGFLLNYTSKVWGLPCEQLSPAVATRRLSGMSFRTLVMDFVTGGKGANHLDGRFLYPEGGYGSFSDALQAALPSGTVKTQAEVTGLEVSGHRITAVEVNQSEMIPVAAWVVSTLPLNQLVRWLGEQVVGREALLAAESLRFRHVRLVFLRLARPRFSEYASIYIPDEGLHVSRVFEPKNRCPSMAPPDETGIGVEIPYFPEDPVADLEGEELAQLVVDELEQTGLLEAREVLGFQDHRLEHAYPVYGLGYERKVETILEALQTVENLRLLGRNGIFRYSHFHDQIRDAREVVRNLVNPDAGIARGLER